MAKIDTIDTGTEKITCLNISDTIGPGGANHAADVMAVQALLNYMCGGSEDWGLYALGTFSALDILPGVSGEYDEATYFAIANFHQSWAKRLLKPSDPIIHPANYGGRVLKHYKTGRLMTITLMSQLAEEVSQINAGTGYLERIFRIYPKLGVWVGQGANKYVGDL